MYIPPAFKIDDSSKLATFIGQHSFATLITHDGTAPFASHLPMLVRSDAGSGMLVSHMARSNPQWRHFSQGSEVLAIFHGPHAYVSPSWYETEPAVPTWNYASVHVYGVPHILSEQEQVEALLDETVSKYESAFEQPWSGKLPEEFRDKLMEGIVAFEIPIQRMEGKFKLGQNRSAADLTGVHEALSESMSPGDHALARLMREEGLVP